MKETKKSNIIDKLVSEFEHLESNKKLFIFVLIMCITMAFTRIGVLFYNPNPVVWGLELHHFDYGLLILMITNLFLLFGRRRFTLYLVLNAIGFGLILDGISFVRTQIVDPSTHELAIYNSTLPSAIFFAIIVIVIIMFINFRGNNRK